MRSLIIEDDADTGQYICNGLKEAGFASDVVPQRRRRTSSCSERAWDVMILDRMLPGDIDGLGIVKTLRSLGKTTRC